MMRALMQRSDFHFDLPPELVAQQPLAARDASRLLQVGCGDQGPRDGQFSDLKTLLRPGDLLVFNNTAVIPARLQAHKESGGQVEILLERALDEQRALVHLRANRKPKSGAKLLLADGSQATMLGRQGPLFELGFAPDKPLLDRLQAIGSIPLPPYIEREPNAADSERYQTVYARYPGAVAAPTAGLHFTKTFISELEAAGIETTEVTLHVGAGTFQPVREEDLDRHQMHSEWYSIGAAAVAAVDRAKQSGGRVVAVGTTAVRTLESAAADGTLQACAGDTRLFIRPGYEFQVVDAMVTNFHLPESTLLMLVSAFSGYERIMAAYRHAVAERYRFFSYGDAMWLSRC